MWNLARRGDVFWSRMHTLENFPFRKESMSVLHPFYLSEKIMHRTLLFKLQTKKRLEVLGTDWGKKIIPKPLLLEAFSRSEHHSHHIRLDVGRDDICWYQKNSDPLMREVQELSAVLRQELLVPPSIVNFAWILSRGFCNCVSETSEFFLTQEKTWPSLTLRMSLF